MSARHDVAGGQPHDVAADDLGRRDDLISSVADHPTGWGAELSECGDRALGTDLLRDADDRVYDDHEHDDRGIR